MQSVRSKLVQIVAWNSTRHLNRLFVGGMIPAVAPARVETSMQQVCPSPFGANPSGPQVVPLGDQQPLGCPLAQLGFCLCLCQPSHVEPSAQAWVARCPISMQPPLAEPSGLVQSERFALWFSNEDHMHHTISRKACWRHIHMSNMTIHLCRLHLGRLGNGCGGARLRRLGAAAIAIPSPSGPRAVGGRTHKQKLPEKGLSQNGYGAINQ